MPTSSSGYHTEQGLAILNYIFPSPTTSPKIDYLSLFFGANDSAYDVCGASQQLVHIDRYRENLKSIVSHPAVSAHNPRIILVTPPPVDEHKRPEAIRADGTVDRGRDAETTAAYARIAKEVGLELISAGHNVVVCDLWSAMMRRAGWPGQGVLPGSLRAERNPVLGEMMYDGLHFASAGYKVLYEEMRRVMGEKWPDSLPEGMEERFPYYADWFEEGALKLP